MIKKYYPLKAEHLTEQDIEINEIYNCEAMDHTDMEIYISRANVITHEALRKMMYG